jgi:hypothetical protein
MNWIVIAHFWLFLLGRVDSYPHVESKMELEKVFNLTSFRIDLVWDLGV